MKEGTATEIYVPGVSIEEAQRASGLEQVLKLGSNENVLGPSSRALAAIQQALPELHLYPSADLEATLVQKLCARLGGGVEAANIVLANGASDLLQLIVHAYVGVGDKVVIPAPTFNVYAVRAQLSKARIVKVPLKDYAIDLPSVLEAAEQARVIFLCNPNNPTGTIATHDALLDFLRKVAPDVLVVLDEAYMEFVDRPDFPRSLEFVQAGHRVMICRTLSKLYGLAGLRIGYGIAPAEVAGRVREQKLTFHHGRLPLIAASAALDDAEYAERSRQMVLEGRAFLSDQLAALGLTCPPSQGNFLLVDDLPLAAETVAREALKRGVIVRDATSFGLPLAIRITIGRPEDNRRVVEVIRDILAGQRQ